MFEINSNNCWDYEIGDFASSYGLGLFDNTFSQDNFIKKLNKGDCYITEKAFITKGKKMNDVFINMTKFHRSLINPSFAKTKYRVDGKKVFVLKEGFPRSRLFKVIYENN